MPEDLWFLPFDVLYEGYRKARATDTVDVYIASLRANLERECVRGIHRDHEMLLWLHRHVPETMVGCLYRVYSRCRRQSERWFA